MIDNFHPHLLGKRITFREGIKPLDLIYENEEGDCMITNETECEIFVESPNRNFWMSKADYWERLGTKDYTESEVQS